MTSEVPLWVFLSRYEPCTKLLNWDMLLKMLNYFLGYLWCNRLRFLSRGHIVPQVSQIRFSPFPERSIQCSQRRPCQLSGKRYKKFLLLMFSFRLKLMEPWTKCSKATPSMRVKEARNYLLSASLDSNTAWSMIPQLLWRKIPVQLWAWALRLPCCWELSSPLFWLAFKLVYWSPVQRSLFFSCR